MKMLPVSMLVAALGCAGAAQAQSTLGDLLDKGASKLTAAEAQSLGPLGVTRQGVDSDAIMTLRADGTVVGTVVNKQGFGASDAQGTWTVDAGGKRCVDVRLPAFNMNWSQCGYTYRLGGQLYGVASDSDRGALVTAYVPTAQLKQ
ncbi:MAG: hypothetical protein HYX47_02615 [Burkholderiales bacterium]|nr:hypothetical protein [Burkholderiales bacterium]